MKKTSAALLALPVAASMLLTGCGGDAKPVASPTGTATSSPPTTAAPTTSASPSTTASSTTDPNIPAAARAHTPAGAEAFVRYFYSQVNIAWTVPRAGILSPLCQPSSKACDVYENSAARLAKEGHRYDGNPVGIKFVGTLDATNPKRYDVLANLVQEHRSEIDRAGKIVLKDKREDFRVHLVLVYTGKGWLVSSIKLMK